MDVKYVCGNCKTSYVVEGEAEECCLLRIPVRLEVWVNTDSGVAVLIDKVLKGIVRCNYLGGNTAYSCRTGQFISTHKQLTIVKE